MLSKQCFSSIRIHWAPLNFARVHAAHCVYVSERPLYPNALARSIHTNTKHTHFTSSIVIIICFSIFGFHFTLANGFCSPHIEFIPFWKMEKPSNANEHKEIQQQQSTHTHTHTGYSFDSNKQTNQQKYPGQCCLLVWLCPMMTMMILQQRFFVHINVYA